MKEYKVALGEKEAILQTPDDMELDMGFSSGLIGIELQDAVARGICKVTERVWPCFYCNRKYLQQSKLQSHLKTHNHETLRANAHNMLKAKAEPTNWLESK